MATTISRYNVLSEYILESTIDFEEAVSTIKCALVYSATPGTLFDATHTQWSQVSANEISGTGYTAGGKALTTSAVTRSTATSTWDADDVSWAPIDSGSNKTFTGAVLYRDGDYTFQGGTVTDPLIAFVLFDSTPANITINAGVTFTIQWNASGLLTLA